jgi:hypothetical protein
MEGFALGDGRSHRSGDEGETLLIHAVATDPHTVISDWKTWVFDILAAVR